MLLDGNCITICTPVRNSALYLNCNAGSENTLIMCQIEICVFTVIVRKVNILKYTVGLFKELTCSI